MIMIYLDMDGIMAMNGYNESDVGAIYSCNLRENSVKHCGPFIKLFVKVLSVHLGQKEGERNNIPF